MVNAVKILWLIALDGTGQSIIHRIGHPPVWEAFSNMSSIKIPSSVHSVPLCDLSILVNQRPMGNILIWKTGPERERTPREGIRVWESIIRESADFTLLIFGNLGLL